MDEAACLSAQMVRYVGTARGIVSLCIRNLPQKTKQKITEGVSDPSELLRSYVANRVTWHQVAQWNRFTEKGAISKVFSFLGSPTRKIASSLVVTNFAGKQKKKS